MLSDDVKRIIGALWKERDWLRCLTAIHEHVSPWHFRTQAKREGFIMGIGFGLGQMFDGNEPDVFIHFLETLIKEYQSNGSLISALSPGSSASN